MTGSDAGAASGRPDTRATLMNINNNHINIAFDRMIDVCRQRLVPLILPACGYAADVLLDRLTQRIVEISHHPFAATASERANSGASFMPEAAIPCGSASLDPLSGALSMTWRQQLSGHLAFLLHWAYCLCAILALLPKRQDVRPAVLIFGVGEESLLNEGNDRQFVHYCRTGPIAPLSNGRRFLIQARAPRAVSTDPDFSYHRNPLIGLLRESRLGWRCRCRLISTHAALLAAYFAACMRMPLLCLLGKDFAYAAIASGLDRAGMSESVVLTISSYASQPLWVRGLHRTTVHMVWYAQNWKPIAFAADRLESHVAEVRWIRVDVHWVWTESFAAYLRSLLPQVAIRAVGPIVWYSPEPGAQRCGQIQICIFDVSPYSDDIALSYGEFSNYNHPRNLFAFIRDVLSMKKDVEEAFGLPVSFLLKTKRGYNPAYDKPYFDYLGELGASGAISLQHHATNIYSLISASHLVIVYPFTSPAYVAEYLDVPAIYYDPTSSVCCHDFGDSKVGLKAGIHFAANREALVKATISQLEKQLVVAATNRN